MIALLLALALLVQPLPPPLHYTVYLPLIRVPATSGHGEGIGGGSRTPIPE